MCTPLKIWGVSAKNSARNVILNFREKRSRFLSLYRNQCNQLRVSQILRRPANTLGTKQKLVGGVYIIMGVENWRRWVHSNSQSWKSLLLLTLPRLRGLICPLAHCFQWLIMVRFHPKTVLIGPSHFAYFLQPLRQPEVAKNMLSTYQKEQIEPFSLPTQAVPCTRGMNRRPTTCTSWPFGIRNPQKKLWWP